MNNTRSQRRSSYPRERDSHGRYFDNSNGGQSQSIHSDRYEQSRSFRNRDEQERDSHGRFMDYPVESRSQGRYQYDDSYREPRYTYPQRRPEYSRTYGRSDSDYGTDQYERNYSNGYSDGRGPRFEYVERERDSQGRYSHQLDGDRRYRNQDQELESGRFENQYEGRTNSRYEDSDYARDNMRRYESDEYYY